MSYGPSEFAQHKILGKFTENDDIKQKLREFKEPEYPEDSRATGTPISRRQWSPKYVVAIDGSHHEVQYDQGFPGAELGFVSVATILIDVNRLQEEADKPSIDPVKFNQVQSAYSFATVLASTNMVLKSDPDSRASFRRQWAKLLEDTCPADDAESLAETYRALYAHKPRETDQRCPLVDVCMDANRPSADFEKGTCACGKYPVYLSDALRIHEGFSDFASNGECFGEVMRVLEHLLLVAFVRQMERLCERSGNWSMFRDTAIVMDGSLAVFGHPAWLSQAIKVELARINQRVNQEISEDLLIFGIEKSGRFFDHWCRLDQKSSKDFQKERTAENGGNSEEDDTFRAMLPGRIPRQSTLLVDDPYIKKFVVPSASDKPHGKDTYYGRPFLYKTVTGALIVGISAILSDAQDDRSLATPAQYPRLPDMLDLLDMLVSMRHPNAIIPLIAAHAEAAIPLNMGEKVLEKLAREHISGNRRDPE
ncbi:hypothetical protein C798_27160 [Herbaspirillum rubrisubalbicans Os34]|uniref:Uncharacterized protein n=1 Tax=Herbaspirillum rubrisubalbicans Os34 TaxID=1235827 RepID=A0A6M3ZYM0_9BURK|nr:DNA double-strand break repair nuclease NurA [Herbaspirillum rubrisubalbicans]QJQ03789.1 hypothetical protein C798_27160 [Herbaspirillum rubrisubalbicans Os34]